MPQVHTYIRAEDMEKWRALPNKSEFIHNALNKVDHPPSPSHIKVPSPPKEEVVAKIKPVKGLKITKKVGDVEVEVISPCPHGFAKGLCRLADCNLKYRK